MSGGSLTAEPGVAPPGAPPTLVAEHLSKVFVGQTALDDVGLELYPGKVHALLGENGSGKSTLIKILSGYHQPEPEARVTVRGEQLTLGSSAASSAAGMRFIHQDRGLIDSLDVVDNLALGTGYRSRWFVSMRKEARAAQEVVDRFGLDVDVRRRAGELSTVEQSILAIARALRDSNEHPPQVLVLDEPTESLSKPEMNRLFDAIRRAAAAGAAVLYVSHNIDEVLEIADTVSVLRDGRLVGTEQADKLDRQRVIELIVGRGLDELGDPGERLERDVALRVEGVTGQIARDVSFEVGVGEIVGLAGISGSGRDELPYLIGGAAPWDGGRLQMQGRTLDSLDPAGALAAGIVFVPGDRAKESAILDLAAFENFSLPQMGSMAPLRWLGARREREQARGWMTRTDVRPCEPARKLSTFSGGNQQKVVLARAFNCEPKLLVLDHPVQGVDIGAKFAIYELLLQAAAEGVSIVVSSSDPEDLVAVCHRVLVFQHGRIASELGRESLTTARITEHSIASARRDRG